ncbi:hypothetical protein [Nocardia sp. NPDC019255]|uniref:hypothetical protein n=1 Tax=Nocardia sp. NPDC019255 TaxID=3154591 RepID=UPI0033FD918A
MATHDRIAYAERELERAQKEVAAAQRFLQLAHEQAQYELDEAAKALMRPGALIAEFGDKMYLSMRHASIAIQRQSGTAELRCSCDAVAEWNLSTGGDTTAYRYVRDACEGAERGCHLVIVRSTSPEPPCEHWLHVPLKLDTGE